MQRNLTLDEQKILLRNKLNNIYLAFDKLNESVDSNLEKIESKIVDCSENELIGLKKAIAEYESYMQWAQGQQD